jgi:U2 small nuclear ribonucleoprotein A'
VQDVDNLVGLSRLVRLSLLDNPINKKENYRLYVIHKLPSLKLLDFSKVKQAERDAAAALYGGGAEAAAEVEAAGGDSAMAEAAPAKKAKVAPTPVVAAAAAKKVGPSAAQLTAITAAIANASTLAEVARLEKALKTGVVPSDLLGGDAMLE